MIKKLAPATARLIPHYLVVVQLPDNRIRFLDGDAITARREHATAFRDEKKAKALSDKWAARSDIKASWVLHEPKMV
jgi:hypothetical protein